MEKKNSSKTHFRTKTAEIEEKAEIKETAKIKAVLMIYPPVGLFMRGEDRCQSEIDESSATAPRTPIDAISIAGVLKNKGIKFYFKDYTLEKQSWRDFRADLKKLNPDALIISTTNATILKDLLALKIAKKINHKIITIMKGALFFSIPKKILNLPEFKHLDIAIRKEADTIISDLVDALNKNTSNIDTSLSKVEGIIYQSKKGWVQTDLGEFLKNLDELPLPNLAVCNNSLYINPDTGNMLTTIETSRGCPFSCYYCLTPIISGKIPRHKSPDRIVDEIGICVKKYKIKEFFFKADTFTINKKNVIQTCKEILKRKLKISFVANSRTDTIDEEMIYWMKKAGCKIIAFGIECGTNRQKAQIKKGSKISDDLKAVALCKKHKIKTYGFFMIGFPNETTKDVEATIKFMFKLDCDFVELHIATPFIGTQLYGQSKALGLISHEKEILGHSYFSSPAMGTKYISAKKLKAIRKKALRKYHLRPKYIFKKILSIKNLGQLKNYIKYGLRLLKNTKQ